MPEIKIFSTQKQRQKFMKGKKFIWFKCFNYINRHGDVDYVINFII